MFWRNETKVSTTFPVDPTVGVIRVDRGDGTPLAVMVNYACHPVVLGPENLEYSADYPSEMRRYLEEQMGHGVMAFFLQGAPGDINPYYDKTPLGDDAVNLMRETGRKLGRGSPARGQRRFPPVCRPSRDRIEDRRDPGPSNRWNTGKLRAVSKSATAWMNCAARRLLREKTWSCR